MTALAVTSHKAIAQETEFPCGVDLVFAFDTSGSMNEELDMLCDDLIDQVIQRLPLGVRITWYAITQTANTCAEGTVAADVGHDVPGVPGGCGPRLVHFESWGPATAILADEFPWIEGAVRVVVPVGDEGPCQGDPCEDPGPDRESIENAIVRAQLHDVLVFPVTGIGSNSCVIALADDLAAATDGVAYHAQHGLTYDEIGLLLVEQLELLALRRAAHFLEGWGPGDRMGFSVDGAGDFDNDGYDDFIVGAHQFDLGDVGDNRGLVIVVSGDDGDLLEIYTGATPGDRLGLSVAGAGDLNNDGFADVIVGAPDALENPGGRAYIYSGADGGQMPWSPLVAPTGISKFGTSVDGAGDVDGDGFIDVIVGGYKGPDNTQGAAFVYSGLDGALLQAFSGESPDDRFGFSVAGAGDFDGDGLDDVIIGAYLNDSAGPDAGRAYVFSILGAELLAVIDGEAAGDRFGISVGGVGDITGDGRSEVIVGAHTNDSAGNDAGAAYVFSADSAPGWHLRRVGEAREDYFGRSVAGAGDTDADGTPDFIVGAWGNDECGLDAGKAYVYSGADGALLNAVTSVDPDSRFAFSVSGAGDVDNDGAADIIVGAYLHDTFIFDNSGAAMVFKSPEPEQPPIPADFDGDGDVDSADLAVLLAAWGACEGCPEDLDSDGDVDSSDLAILLASWT